MGEIKIGQPITQEDEVLQDPLNQTKGYIYQPVSNLSQQNITHLSKAFFSPREQNASVNTTKTPIKPKLKLDAI
jgi:hypothetical protein